MKEIKVGKKHIVERISESKDSAINYASGGVDVYSTPAMVGLMECAAKECLDEFLEEGYSTVGISLNIKHLAATPIGMKVRAEAEIVAVEGKKIVFKVEAFDEVEKIGEGTHERFIVDMNKFLNKVNSKLKKEE
ncbi:thioesterase family protein [Caloramator proteoclasticus]|uniref:Thioesterase superfamily n=1 Tax=Caloramator proteoclasticus DSM 10124 TaxID=1121262 RepID=A0A1M4YPD4_9CLOT|nr:thioesterase family protein [Caloramator proteoclasticus]SHF07256.1 Thioesterase superfamily [Caloramator proteoclasticus DSM 10124]